MTTSALPSPVDNSDLHRFLEREPLLNGYLRALAQSPPQRTECRWVLAVEAGELIGAAAWVERWLPGLDLPWCGISHGSPAVAPLLAEALRELQGPCVITGGGELVALVAGAMGVKAHAPFRLDARDGLVPLPEIPPGVRRAVEADLPRLAGFYAAWGCDPEAWMKQWSAVPRRAWLVEQEGELVAAALTHAETGDTALVGGVFTQPEHRGKGYAGACVAALCAEVEREGRRPILYYERENHAAAAVYRKLGFREAASWFNGVGS